jgi:uncharacterized cofD-like protein
VWAHASERQKALDGQIKVVHRGDFFFPGSEIEFLARRPRRELQGMSALQWHLSCVAGDSMLTSTSSPHSTNSIQKNRSSKSLSAAVPLRCVAIGGGTGLPVVLQGLRRALYPDSSVPEGRASDLVTAIVTVTDDGGSSGRLRSELGILPPGDVRNCLAALAPDDSPFTALLQHRFAAGNDLAGHAVGNLLLAALTQMAGEFQTAVERLGGLMRLQGCVLVSTAEDVTLKAEFQSGEIIRGETAIVARGSRIQRLSLERSVRPVPEAVRALVNADVIVVGPGSLYTSILPNLLVGGIAATMAGVRAVRIYVANVMTEPGETDGYSLADHLTAIRAHVGFDLFDYVLINRRPIGQSVAARYALEGSLPIQPCQPGSLGPETTVIERDLAWDVTEGKLRHGSADLASAILELALAGRPAAISDATGGSIGQDTFSTANI